MGEALWGEGGGREGRLKTNDICIREINSFLPLIEVMFGSVGRTDGRMERRWRERGERACLLRTHRLRASWSYTSIPNPVCWWPPGGREEGGAGPLGGGGDCFFDWEDGTVGARFRQERRKKKTVPSCCLKYCTKGFLAEMKNKSKQVKKLPKKKSLSLRVYCTYNLVVQEEEAEEEEEEEEEDCPLSRECVSIRSPSFHHASSSCWFFPPFFDIFFITVFFFGYTWLAPL